MRIGFVIHDELETSSFKSLIERLKDQLEDTETLCETISFKSVHPTKDNFKENLSRLSDQILQSDTVLFFFNDSALKDSIFMEACRWAEDKLVIENKEHHVVLFEPFKIENIPKRFFSSAGKTFLYKGKSDLPELIEAIDIGLASEITARIRFQSLKVVREVEQRQRIEEGQERFIDPAIKWLDQRKKSLSQTANVWNSLGYLSLILGVMVGYFFMNLGVEAINTTKIPDHGESVEWSKVVFLSIKSLIIIALLIAASRYSFNLAKTYVDQAIKNGDRRHAISFGKFYLQVFGGTVEPSEFKEIFKDWNLSTESPFTKLDSSEHDPKLIESLSKALEPFFKKGKAE